MNKSRLRWFILGGVALLALILVYPFARNTWLIHRAKKSFAGGEDRKAALQCMRMIQIDPNYAPAAVLLGDIAEKNLSRDALRWRIYATKIDPSTKNQITLARTSIHFKEWEWADQALLAVKAKDRETSDYMQTAGALALALHRNENAARLFEKAAQLDPENKNLLLNVSITRLALPDPELKKKGREDLLQLKKNSELAVPALLALIQDAVANHAPLQPLIDELFTHPCGFPEYFAALEALAETGSLGVEKLLAEIQEKQAKEPGEIYALSNWMVRQGQAPEARKWLDHLSPAEQKITPVPMAYAECLVSLKDWKMLQEKLSTEKWPGADILRNAFLWRAKKEASTIALSENGLSDWKQALRGREVSPAELYLVANLFWSWGWKTEAEDLWWNLAAQTKNPEIALKTLDQIFRAEKNTRKLWWVSQRAQQTNPRDKVAQNNYAMLSLLLNMDLGNAYTIADTLYRQQPQNPAFLSTYAFALYRKGRTKDALLFYSKLDPKLLEQPDYAFYYAVLLKAEGKKEEAARYFKLADKAALFPEEKALME